MKLMLTIIICLFPISSNAAQMTLKQYATNPFGNILFIRHALAPGFGDPSNFDIKKCKTQRNLNSEGRKQANAIGKLIRESGIKFDKIYSSEWCRCAETARLLKLGAITPYFGLNSFFQNLVPKEKALRSLNKLLKKLKKNNETAIMVTHYVTINAITGLTIESGGAVAFDIETGQSKRIIYQ